VKPLVFYRIPQFHIIVYLAVAYDRGVIGIAFNRLHAGFNIQYRQTDKPQPHVSSGDRVENLFLVIRAPMALQISHDLKSGLNKGA
jgi:hypothetical protein